MSKQFNSHDRVVDAAFKAHLSNAWKDYILTTTTPSVKQFRVWLYDPFRHDLKDEETVGNSMKRFIIFLTFYWTFRRAVRNNKGELLFLLCQWILPYQAGLTASNMYFPWMLRWIIHVKSLCEKTRAFLMANLCVNMDGREGHFIPVDQFMEHFIRVLKSMWRGGSQALDREHIIYLSNLAPLAMKVKQALHRFWPPTRVTTSHTQKHLADKIKAICEVIAVTRSTTSQDLLKPNTAMHKNCFPKFVTRWGTEVTKINLASGSLEFAHIEGVEDNDLGHMDEELGTPEDGLDREDLYFNE
jgi:hypothetical protein